MRHLRETKAFLSTDVNLGSSRGTATANSRPGIAFPRVRERKQVERRIYYVGWRTISSVSKKQGVGITRHHSARPIQPQRNGQALVRRTRPTTILGPDKPHLRKREKCSCASSNGNGRPTKVTNRWSPGKFSWS